MGIGSGFRIPQRYSPPTAIATTSRGWGSQMVGIARSTVLSVHCLIGATTNLRRQTITHRTAAPIAEFHENSPRPEGGVRPSARQNDIGPQAKRPVDGHRCFRAGASAGSKRHVTINLSVDLGGRDDE